MSSVNVPEHLVSNHLAEILVLAGGAIQPAPAVPASTRISAGLKRVQEHSSPVNMPAVRMIGPLAAAGRHTGTRIQGWGTSCVRAHALVAVHTTWIVPYSSSLRTGH